jgi:hypothetical protein
VSAVQPRSTRVVCPGGRARLKAFLDALPVDEFSFAVYKLRRTVLDPEYGQGSRKAPAGRSTETVSM